MRLLTLVTLLFSSSTLAADARWGLRWRAPEACISAADLSALVQERLGRPVFALNPDFRVDGVMETGTTPRWKARLTVVSAAGEVMGTREVTGDEPDCRALDARLAFVVAVSIDPKATGSIQPEAPPAVRSPPAPAAPVPAPAPRRLNTAPSVWVELESDNKNVALFRHLGTTYGYAGGQSMVLSTITQECAAPCQRFVEEPRSDFFIAGNGITMSASFSLLSHPEGVKLKVRAGSAALRWAGWVLGVLGVSALAVGIPVHLILAKGNEPYPGVQNPYGSSKSTVADMSLGLIIGGGAALAGAIPMIAFSGTKVEFFPISAPTDAPGAGRVGPQEI